MITRCALTLFCCFATGLYLVFFEDVAAGGFPRSENVEGPLTSKAAAMSVSNSLASISQDLSNIDRPTKPTELKQLQRRHSEIAPSQSLKSNFGVFKTASLSSLMLPEPSVSFDGLSNFDNVAAFGQLISPPDMVGEAGRDHYVQVVNTLFRVFTKTGQPLSNPIPLNHLFLNLGTPCSLRNDGLPNVVYDQLADRWLISQVCSLHPPFRQMIAVSQTGDPMGAWFAYEFVMPNVKINDFPKISMWPDGYYMTTNEVFGSDYKGTGIFAFDRKKMLAGDAAAGYIYFSLPTTLTLPGGMLPADLDGLRPPPKGTSAIIATHTATEYGDPNDALRLYDFHADFENPSLSTLTERPESPMIVAAFDPTSPNGRADISQPPPGEKLDSMSDTLMSRLAYRNLGSYQTLVANQTVRLTPSDQAYRAGVRVYELRNSSGAYVPFVQSTIGDTVSSRWIGSAAQDHQGNTAVQYNFVSDEKRVAINYTGRLVSDTPNTFHAERSLIEGTGVQKAFGWRWGEYSGMSVDPTDDCTFWITNAYYTLASEQWSDFGWLTRIGAFKFDECTAAPSATIIGTVTNPVTGQPIKGVQIEAASYSRRSLTNGGYGPLKVLPGPFQLKASKHGYRDTTRSIDIADGQTQQQDFALEPIPIVATTSQVVIGESCGLNRAIEPGETVSVDITLRNEGAAAIANLNAQLMPSGSVLNPGPAQNYGPMPAGGEPKTRTFSFTVAANVSCGSDVPLNFQLSDGTVNIGSYSFTLKTGAQKIALKESFDRTSMGGLPARWMRSGATSTGIPDPARDWRLTNAFSTSFTKSAFSPTPIQPGINELISPVFNVTSADARLTFQNRYDLETTFLRNRLFDGSVVEISYDGGAWQDILAAGGVFETGGYDGVLDAIGQNPLAGRSAWSGRSGMNIPAEFVTVSVKLPANALGHKVRVRWRVGTDLGNSRIIEGQFIDDVVVTDGYSCTCIQ